MSATPSIRDEQARGISGGGGSPLTVQEQDGSPSVSDVTTIKVTNGTLTDDGGGTVSIDTGGGSGTPSDTVTDETTYGISPAAGSGTDYSRGDHTHGSQGHDAHANLTGVSANQHHTQSHNHSSSGDGTSLSPATLILPAATTPAETAEGSAVWDSDDDVLTIGDGVGRKTMVDLAKAQTLTNKTLTAPTIGDLTNATHNHQNNAGGGTLAEAALSLSDNTTNDVSTSKHGFAPKLPNDATKFFRGDGSYAVPTGGAILNVNTTPVGNVGGGEDDLITYTVPANTLDTNGQYLHFVAAGIFAASANNKQVKAYFGSQLLIDTGALVITGAGSWRIDAYIVRTGAATQRAIAFFLSDETALNAEATYSDPTETLSGTVVLKCTGTGTSDNDIVEKFALTEKGGGTAGGGGGGGTTYGQVLDYPTTFTGDVIDGSSTTPFVDVAAFDTKEVLNSRVLHLQTLGASKDQRVRVTLNTTKAGAFDVSMAFAVHGMFWSDGNGDQFFEVRLSTSADAQLAIARIYPRRPQAGIYNDGIIFEGSGTPSFGSNYDPSCPLGETITLRFVRDGSNVISFYWGWGTAPLALIGLQKIADNLPFTQTVSGTLERIEFATHSSVGPGSSVPLDWYIDYVESL